MTSTNTATDANQIDLPDKVAQLEARIAELEQALAQRDQTGEASASILSQLSKFLPPSELALLDQLSVAAWISDLNGTIQGWTSQAEKLLGYSHHEALGKPLGFFYQPHLVEIMTSRILREVRNNKTFKGEFSGLTKEGHSILIETSVRTVVNDEGQPQFLIGLCQDISQYKQAETELSEREYEFRTLSENMPDIVVRVDANFNHIYVNPAIQTITGRAPKEFIGKPVIGYEEPQLSLWNQALTEVFNTGQNRVIELSFNILGKPRHFQTRLAPEFSKDGSRVESVLGVYHDITELKLTQQALEQREEEFKTLVENSPDIITRFDKNLRYIYVSPSITRFTGVKPDILLGKTREELNSQATDLTEWNTTMQRVFETGQEQELEYQFNNTKGPVYLQTRLVPEYNREGKIDSVLGISRDITRLKQIEAALDAEKERLAVTLRSIGEGVIATDPTGKIVLINHRAETLTGWSATEATSLAFDKVVQIVETNNGLTRPLEKLIEQVLESGEMIKLGGVPRTVRLISRYSKSEHIIEGWANPIRSQDDQSLLGVVVVFEDVTHKRKLEEELQKADKLESVGMLAGGIAHDFNNFLAAILGNLAFIRRSLPEDNSLFKKLREAENACLKASTLTQQLLTFARGGAPLKKAASLTSLLEETARFVLSGTSSRCEVKVPADLWQAEIDEGQISQVVQNLVINGQQAMPGGGQIEIEATNVTIQPTEDGKAGSFSVSSRARRQLLPIKPGHYVQITVSDQGIGIPARYLPHIFDPYFTTKQEGTGLGLAVCYSIIRNHDGYIEVESEPGIGTTFFLYLPAILPEAALAGAAKTSPDSAQSPQNEIPALKILVMDDQDMILDLLSDLLNEEGYEVECAHHGEEAIQLYLQASVAGKPFSVVIMDLTIPGKMGGREAMAQLLQLDPAAKGIVSSGYSNDPITSNYQQYGFKAVVPKPFDIDELLEVIKQVAAS